MDTRKYTPAERKAIKRIQRSPFYQSERLRRCEAEAAALTNSNEVERLTRELQDRTAQVKAQAAALDLAAKRWDAVPSTQRLDIIANERA